MDPNKTLRREDIVSWIEEFSYIYSSGLFDLDDNQQYGENDCHTWQDSAEIEIGLDPVLQYPKAQSDASSSLAETLPSDPPCLETHDYGAEFTRTELLVTPSIETDGSSIDQEKLGLCYGGHGPTSLESDATHGRKKQKGRFFGSHRERYDVSGHLGINRVQSLPPTHVDESHGVSRLRDVGFCLPLGKPDQHLETRQQWDPQHERDRESPQPPPRRISSQHRVTRKPGICPLRDIPEHTRAKTRSRTPSIGSSYSWLSDVKDRLKSISTRTLKRKASTFWLRDKASLPNEDFQVTPPRIRPIPVAETNSSSKTLPLPQNLSRETSAGSKTLLAESNISPGYPSHASIPENDLKSGIEPTPPSPRPYQCTFCLAQCTSKLDWMRHEQTYHFQGQRWVNAPERVSESQEIRSFRTTFRHSSDTYVSRSVASFSSGTDEDFDEPMNDLFWNCGFCNFVLRSWDERQEHIANEHFEQGMTMSLWDPLKAPYPWKRRIGAPTPGFSSRGLEELLAVQAPVMLESESLSRDYEEISSSQSVCKLCNLPAQDKKAMEKHQEMWHKPRSVWSCPAAVSPDDTFFETSKRSDGSVRDQCLCCGKSFKYTQREPEILMRHLRNAHGFNENPCLQMCFDKKQFYLHLANSHDFYLEYIQDFMLSCERRGNAPTMMLESY